jgi:hypothetical protein
MRILLPEDESQLARHITQALTPAHPEIACHRFSRNA